jgi:hypothetical protein
MSTWIYKLLIFQVFVTSLVIIALPILEKYKQQLIASGKINHPFTVGQLQAETGWTFYTALIGFILLAGSVYSIYLLKKDHLKRGFYTLTFTCGIFIYSVVLFVTPGAERMSQNSAISFLKSIKGKDVYIQTLYKSYAMLFYTEAKPQLNKNAYDLSWLLTGQIDKDAYFLMRADKKDENLKQYTELQVVFEKNGYVFCKRPAVINNSFTHD